MPVLHSIALGVIQGLTEFLPISSSAHLLIIPKLLGWSESGLTFDVALNTGTFLAAFLYFIAVWWALLKKGLIERQKKELRFIGLLIVATIPAAIFGSLGQKLIAEQLRQPLLAAVMMIIFGIVLWLAEKKAKLSETIDDLTWTQVIWIGLGQALALIPGVSRSGITIATGLVNHMTKEEATRFSFLLLAPVSLGAAGLELPKVVHAPTSELHAMAVGVVVSFLVGLVAIHFMLKLLNRYGFKPYIWYRFAAGLIFLVLIIR